MSNLDPSAPLLWPAVDVGGTSIRVVLIADRGDERPETVVRIEVPSVRGLSNLADMLRRSLAEASASAEDRGFGVARALGIGTPGRLEQGPGGRRIIAPRTAANLESFPGEMDGVDLAGELAQALGLPLDRVFWENDAVVQGRYLIGELLRDPESAAQLKGHVVVCINPGTGLGGCVAEVTEGGAVEVFTDGHISELLLHPVELECEFGDARVAVRSAADGSAIGVRAIGGDVEHGELVRSPAVKQAEDLLSGTGLANIAVVLDRCAAKISPTRTLFGVEEEAIDGALLSDLIEEGAETIACRGARFIGNLAGLALARLLEVLRSGEARKSSHFPDWSQADRDRLCAVSRFVFGGGMTKTPLGQRMIEGARAELHRWPELRIYEMDEIADDAGALGAFSLISASVCSQTSRRGS